MWVEGEHGGVLAAIQGRGGIQADHNNGTLEQVEAARVDRVGSQEGVVLGLRAWGRRGVCAMDRGVRTCAGDVQGNRLWCGLGLRLGLGDGLGMG